ncbi:MAG: hypothetical protein AB7G62_11555 [Magnetospirillum sp.]
MIRLVLSVLAFLALAAWWPGWHQAEQPLGQAVDPAAFVAQTEAFAARYQRGERVEAPAGEVPLLARKFEFWPDVKLQPDHSYRLRIMAQDSVHSVAVNGVELLLVPGFVQDIDVSPGDQLELRCNEYCGLGHNRMRLKLY